MMSVLNPSMGGMQPADDMLEQASSMVDRFLGADKNYMDLSELLQVQKHTQPSVSGLHDFDYPSLSDPKIGLGSMPELSTIKRVPLPAELVEQFGHMQCNCIMGLFPEISRAWVSIDSDIFVWNFETGGDLAYYDGLSETILSAGLVKPKPGIFQPHILYLLCLATPVDIVLLGVSFMRPYEGWDHANLAITTDPAQGEMHLLPEPLFSIPTDNTHIISITGTDSGRIFMAGKDGCLYELAYRAEDGWFSRKCRKINHSQSTLSFMLPSFLNFSFSEEDPLVQISVDNSRNILYTRSEKGTIQAFDLGIDGQGMSRIAAVSQHTTVQNAVLVAKTIDRSNFQPIVDIAAIPNTESVNIHLVAITHTGVRLYFSACPFHNATSRPSMLSLVHVRLPPGFSASAAPQRPTKVHMAHYKKGTLLLSASQTEDSDLLWTMGPDSFPFQRQLMETHATTGIDGRTWTVAEVPTPVISYGEENLPSTLLQAHPPLVVTQHMEPSRRFVLLTAQGTYLMNKLYPVDQLRHILIDNNGPDVDEVKAFFKLHKEDQACATCLILACSSLTMVEQQVCEWATRAFFLYGGEADINYGGYSNMPVTSVGPVGQNTGAGSGLGSSVMQSPAGNFGASASFNTSTPLRGVTGPTSPMAYNPMAQQPQQQPTMGGYGRPAFGQDIKFSGRHNGLCLYVARILRPLWELPLVSNIPVQTGQGQMECLASRLHSHQIGWFLEQLTAVRNFMEKNSQFTSPIIAESMNSSYNLPQRMLGGHGHDIAMVDGQIKKKNKAEAQAAEKMSLLNLQQLITCTCECLGLWRILCDHQFHVVASGLTKDQQNALRTMSFRNFVSSGREMSSALLTCLINRYLGDNATTDAISSRLQEVCPSLYSPEDAICSKANELLQAAKHSQNKHDQEKRMKEAQQLYKQIALNLDLPTVSNQFAAVRFYPGIVDLALTAASKRDPQDLALHFYKNGEPPEDVQGYEAFMARMDCYRCITDTLGYLLSTSMSHPQAPSVPKSPGPPPAPDPNRLTNAEAEQYTEQISQMALRCNDEMLHVAIYDWFISMNLTEKLLEIQSPYLEPYLKRAAETQPDRLIMLDLLWRYYEKIGNYSAASHILAKLAERHGTDVTLRRRIEYLSRAIMSAKSSTMRTSSASEGQFLHELEEKMEVARLQLQIFETISSWKSIQAAVQQALARLNSQLMDISTLYGEFADVFDLSECKLAIIHCAGHYDPTLVESLWHDIIDKELDASKDAVGQTKMHTLSNKLVNLGKMYGTSDRYFPLAFLVKMLEERSCRLNFDLQFVFRTMQDIGFTIPKLHEIYDRLFKSNDAYWKSVKRPLHLLQVICKLLTSFADAPTLVPAHERRHFTTVALDSIAGYLVELQSMTSVDTAITSLIASFRATQAKLE